MADDELDSFVATGYKHRFTKDERLAYRVAQRQEVGTFILAHRDWNAEWEMLAMDASLMF